MRFLDGPASAMNPSATSVPTRTPDRDARYVRLEAARREFLVPALEALGGWTPVADRPGRVDRAATFQIYDYPPVDGGALCLFHWRGAVHTTYGAYLPVRMPATHPASVLFLLHASRLLAGQGYPFEPHGSVDDHPFCGLLGESAHARLRTVTQDVLRGHGLLLCSAAEDRTVGPREVEPPPSPDEFLAGTAAARRHRGRRLPHPAALARDLPIRIDHETDHGLPW